MVNIITDSQWAEWKLSPVTQAFFEYLRNKKYEANMNRDLMVKSEVRNLDGFDLARLNGIEEACTGLLRLTLEEMVNANNDMREYSKNYKKYIKESLGVDL